MFEQKFWQEDQLPRNGWQICKEANDFIDFSQWTFVKTYPMPLKGTADTDVKTYKKWYDGQMWAARWSSSSDEDYSFEKFRKYIIGVDEDGRLTEPTNHTKHEADYMPAVKHWESKPMESVETADSFGKWCRVRTEYKFNSYLQKREFNDFIYISDFFDESSITGRPEDKGNSVAFVVSLAAKVPSVKAGFTAAFYTSIEKVRRVASTGDTEWSMTTASDAGGFVPRWVQNLVVCETNTHDVPILLNWFQERQ